MRGRGTRRLPRETVERIALDLGADNLERSGSDASHDRRYPVRSSVTQLHVPARNTQAADGTTFSGLPANRIAALALTEAEQATNSTNDRVLASGSTNPERAVDTAHTKDQFIAAQRQFARRSVGDLNNAEAIPAGVKMHVDDTVGTVNAGRVGGTGRIAKAHLDLNLGNIDGTLSGRRISWKGVGKLPKSIIPAPDFPPHVSPQKHQKDLDDLWKRALKKFKHA
jgi:hypothetical protein